ncbi:MAG: helix-turn-helix domain-containing protein [Prevotella sp.]|jgi:AraC-like DNA-binding protein|nr:helix-turn-helix domain-containing protein [Prevotella sp.]
MSDLQRTGILNCPNADTGPGATIELVRSDRGPRMEGVSFGDELVFVLKGRVRLSFAGYAGTAVEENNFAFIPANCRYRAGFRVNSIMMVMRPYERIQFCDCLRGEDLAACFSADEQEYPIDTGRMSILEIKPQIRSYLDLLRECIEQGLCCKLYYRNKIRELIFLLRAFYSRQDLARFFHRSLSPDTAFSTYVIQNSHRHRSVADLAGAMNYTVSGFEKHFKRVFGVAPYRWMLGQKAERIYHEICFSERNFKQISDDYGFATVSHFVAFVRGKLGDTPGNIRRFGFKA